MKLYTLSEIADVYIDAYVANSSDSLLFLSAWGRDTAIQELLAKLSLYSNQGGLATLTLRDDKSTERIFIQEREKLTKFTGRVNKDSLLGGLTHLFVYDGLAKQVDKASQRALLLKLPQEEEKIFRQRLWQVVQELSVIPFLPEWECLLDYFAEQNYISLFQGFNMDAVQVTLNNEEVEALITSLIQRRILALPKSRSHLTLAYANK